jgi:hypothetical protein
MLSLSWNLVWLFVLQAVTVNALASDDNGVGETTINLSELFRQRNNNTDPFLRPRELEKRYVTSAPGTLENCYWNVTGAGKFNSHFKITNFTAELNGENGSNLVAYTKTGYPCP